MYGGAPSLSTSPTRGVREGNFHCKICSVEISNNLARDVLTTCRRSGPEEVRSLPRNGRFNSRSKHTYVPRRGGGGFSRDGGEFSRDGGEFSRSGRRGGISPPTRLSEPRHYTYCLLKAQGLPLRSYGIILAGAAGTDRPKHQRAKRNI